VLSKSFLTCSASYERYLLNYYFLPENLTFHTASFTPKLLFTNEFRVPFFQVPSIKSHLASWLYKSQDSKPYLLPCTHSPAAWLPLFPAALHILPKHLVSPGVIGKDEKLAAAYLPPLRAAHGVL